jgi:hypothetical protein
VATEVHLPLQSQFVKRHKQLLQKCLEHVSECSESKQRQSTSSHMSRGYKSKELSMQLKRQSGPSLLIDGTKTRTNAIILLLGGRSRTTGYGLRTSPIQRQMTKSLCLVSSWSLRRSAARLCSSNVKYRQVPLSKSSTPPSSLSLAVLWTMVRRACMCRGSSSSFLVSYIGHEFISNACSSECN